MSNNYKKSLRDLVTFLALKLRWRTVFPIELLPETKKKLEKFYDHVIMIYNSSIQSLSRYFRIELGWNPTHWVGIS